MPAPSHRDLLQLAWPLVLAQLATALTGVVDTAVMGRTGDRFDLAAVAVASVTFSFLYWAFGFLRMATTGLTARARGQGDEDEARAVLLRAGIVGGVLGLGLLAVHPVVREVVPLLFGTEPAVTGRTLGYLDARIGGAPAALFGFAVNGWLLGTGRTRALLGFQVVLNGTNAVLDALFVTVFDLGPAGIGLGTMVAEWTAALVGLWLVRDAWTPAARRLLGVRDRWGRLFSANVDILLRTVALLSAIAWFVRAGTRLGAEVVAGNQVLLQFVAVSAFVLDSFAFLTEKEAGEAVGAGSVDRLRTVARRTTVLSFGFGALFTVVYLLGGPWILDVFVDDEAARVVARTWLPVCALIPVLGIPAWQLDGVFLGATRGATLRNAAIASTLVYIAIDLALRPWGNAGVWTAFTLTYLLRAGFLGLGWPGLMRALSTSTDDNRAARP